MRLSALIHLQRLRRNQWLPGRQLREIQRKKLVAVFRHACERVPYYRELFRSAGIEPADVQTVEDLRKVPVTTRSDLQALPREAITARGTDLRACKDITTAGSSGAPLHVTLSPADGDAHDMAWARTALANGQRLWDKVACLKFHIPPKRWFEHFGIWRREAISLCDALPEQVRRLESARPSILRGNAFGLGLLAHFVRHNGISGIRPRLVFSMGSILDDVSRRLIASTFHAEVFDYYGATELGCIAWECAQHNGYHVNTDTVVLEVLADGEPARPGQMGRIVCTGLLGFAMPFIRYDVGDLGVLSDAACPCGRGLPLLASVEGRADDFFVTPDGAMRSPSLIVNRVKLIPGIARFRFVQRSVRHVSGRVVPGEGFSVGTLRDVERTMAQIMGDGVRIDVRATAEIGPDPAGKIRSLASHVPRGAGRSSAVCPPGRGPVPGT